jgi:hypothetical protein
MLGKLWNHLEKYPHYSWGIGLWYVAPTIMKMRASKWKEKLEFSLSRYGTAPHSISSRQWRKSGIPDTPFMMMTYIEGGDIWHVHKEYEIGRMKAALPSLVRG